MGSGSPPLHPTARRRSNANLDRATVSNLATARARAIVRSCRTARRRTATVIAMTDADDLHARVRALEDALTTTQARLDNLLADLARTRVGGFRAMRDSHQCPACGGRALLHVRKLREFARAGQLDALGLTHEERWTGTRVRAPLEAYACRTCFLVELHAADLDHVTIDGERIVALDPEPDVPPDGPFR